MKKSIIVVVLVIVAFSIASAVPADAYGGHWGHGGFRGSIWIGPGWGWGWVPGGVLTQVIHTIMIRIMLLHLLSSSSSRSRNMWSLLPAGRTVLLVFLRKAERLLSICKSMSEWLAEGCPSCGPTGRWEVKI